MLHVYKDFAQHLRKLIDFSQHAREYIDFAKILLVFFIMLLSWHCKNCKNQTPD